MAFGVEIKVVDDNDRQSNVSFTKEMVLVLPCRIRKGAALRSEDSV